MNKPGRKSTAELSSVIVDLNKRTPPPPPSDLNAKQARVWCDTVATLPGDWLTRAAYPILTEYCRSVCRLNQLEDLIADAWRDEGRLNKLLAMAQRETKTMTACARALRLTPQSRIHPKRGVSQRPLSYYDQMELEENADA